MGKQRFVHQGYTYPDVVEVDLNQVGVVPLHSRQRLFYVSGVGLFIGDWFILGALDHTYNTFTEHAAGDCCDCGLNNTHLNCGLFVALSPLDTSSLNTVNSKQCDLDS